MTPPTSGGSDFGHALTESKPCCANLRCKSMTYRVDERPGRLHYDESMTYWCDCTNDPIGPDRDIATHPRCQPGRKCYEPGP
jgi:hypothetical protein